jgi:hypothetical protein
MRLAIALAGLALGLALVPAAGASTGDTMRLVPDWPDSFQEARSEPIHLLPGPPIQEQARHTALTPGSSTAETRHTFTWQLVNPDGSPGPAGDLPLAPGQPVVLDVYLSVGGPSAAPATQLPEDVQAGLAPSLTVEANLTFAGQSLEPERLTETLVNTPLGEQVYRYRFTFDVRQDELAAGEGMSLELSVHQTREAGEQATQPGWRIHTGAAHPSGVQLSLDPVDDPSPAPLDLQRADEAEAEELRKGAYGALAASALAGGWALRRGYRELRGD